ncbi:MAG: hypothetical protein AAF597_12615 [Bacteroidota bacterium]
MKNKLEPWEEGLAGRMKEHEFSFDPAAMAGFESLLAAETTVAGGEAAPANPAPPPAAAGTAFSAKLIGLAVGVLAVGALLVYGLLAAPEGPVEAAAAPAVEDVVATPPISTATEAQLDLTPEAGDAPEVPEPAQPTRHPASAAPLNPTNVPVHTAPGATDMIGGTPPSEGAFSPKLDLPRPRPTSGYERSERIMVRQVRVATLPVAHNLEIVPLRARPLPTVKITPEPAQMTRDRNALFPEVIDRNRP